MKRLFVLSLVLFSVSLFAQSTIDFETVGQDFVWTIFANGPQQDSTDYAVVANPSASGINTSSQVGKYFVRTNADPWAGIFTDSYGSFVLTADNSKPTVMVYKDVISNFNLKLEGPGTPGNHDVNVPNTVINQWEKLEFDYSTDIGKTINRLTIIPDFPATRTAGSTNYFDNIEFVHTPVPVEFTSFRASVGDNGVELTWTTATELNNVGFDIERRAADATHFDKVGFVKGQGTTTNISSYTFVDKNAAGKLFYRLKQLDQNGSFDFSKTIEVDATKLVKFELSQNYPNPFNPTTTISYSIPQSTFVTLKIYNILGSEVATLVNGMVEGGIHKVNFNAVNLNSGVYFYTIKAGNFTETKKLMLTK